MERRPVVIVGSGPAGTAAALHLQRRDPGLAARVLVLEKARHPRVKICGGGLIPQGLRALREMGVELTVPHVTVHRAQVTTPARTITHDERDLCHIVRRAEFDAALVAACKARGIAVREDEAVIDARRDGDGVRLQTQRGEYHAQVVIGADGAGSVVRRCLVDGAREQTARALMCDVPLQETEWGGFAAQRYDFDFRAVARGVRGYRWAFPCLIDGQPHANVGAYSMTPMGSALNRCLEEYLAAMTAARPRVQAFPIHWYRPGTRLAAPHVLLAGDAAGVDPLMGEGISLAFEYGALAAAEVHRALRTGDFSGAAYQRAVEASWLGRKLRRLHLAARLFYGPTWRVWFAVAERSARLRAIGVRWYNGVDGWDRRSGWQVLGAVLRHDARAAG